MMGPWSGQWADFLTASRVGRSFKKTICDIADFLRKMHIAKFFVL